VPLWPATNGYSLRVTHLLRELAKTWEIQLVAAASPASADQTAGLPLAGSVVVELGGQVVTMPWQFDTERLREAVVAVVAAWQPDAALLWSGAEILAPLPGGLRAVGDRIDCAALSGWRAFRRLRSIRERATAFRAAARAALYERHAVRALAATTVVGEADALALRRLSGRDTVHVVPNGVALGPVPRREWESSEPTVVFTGVMNFDPNIAAARYFAHRVWPLVHAVRPDARFLIVGRSPDLAINGLAAQPGIAVMPDVPDINAVLRASWVAVAPMRSGSGIKNKVLEAWASGKPVVMSPMARNGLRVGGEVAELVARTPRDFACLVLQLLQDTDRRLRLGLAAYTAVAERHTWSGAANELSRLLTGTLPDSSDGAPS
jgi:glycosyltransferase involved in cell wall biosynthesis